jgi:crotonobetainyl-CoA:carnitine CoA-transferase CaiB-like acyl-CoA transferase
MARARVLADELPIPVDLDELVFGRARLLGLRSNGRVSAGGTCRLVPTADGWVAVNLPRPWDREALPAVLEDEVDPTDPWPAIERHAARRAASDVADRYQLLGVAAAVLNDPAVDGSRAATQHPVGPVDGPGSRRDTPLVVDLSSMWAGPLCAQLLGRTGMRVVKVESVDRPDGARLGDPRFFEWLHAGHESVMLDLRTASGVDELRRLLALADVVIEGSRPRALAQLGIDADEIVASRAGRTWVSITGYGRSGDAADRVAFGDDAAVAGGLVGYDQAGLPVFCADAIADPLTGVCAAVAALGSIAAGGGHRVDVAMAAVARSVAEGS